MFTKRLALVAAVAALCLAAPVRSHAFEFTGLGASLGFVNPEDLDGAFMVGGHVNFDRPGGLRLQPSIHYWNADGISDVIPALDLSYRFSTGDRVTPYLGTGLALHMYNADDSDFSDTNVGLNLFGGVVFPGPRSDLFVEARHSVSDLSQTALLGGISLRMR